MCTAFRWRDFFGRNLDLERSYGEKNCILPRKFPIPFCRMGINEDHYAIIGMAVVAEGIPLFYDGANEKGLCAAGLNFPGNAYYPPEKLGADNVSAFELIPWLLCQCATVKEARQLLERTHLAAIPVSASIPLSPLHWIVSDQEQSIVVESTAAGLQIYDDPVEVLTNNPPFPYQMFNLNHYRSLSPATPENQFSARTVSEPYCQGLGGLGLPGDVSSMSRFVRGAFYTEHAAAKDTEVSGVSQVFHMLGAVEMPRGSCKTDAGQWDITVYSACIHMPSGRYYYTTYDNRQISCVDLRKENLEGDRLLTISLEKRQQIHYHRET